MSKTPFKIEDLYLHLKLSELDFHPEGTEVACTVRSVDKEKDQYQFSIWSFPLDGRAPLQLTQSVGGTDNSPHWAPDGSSLAFLSNRTGSLQIHTLAPRGGDAAQVGKFESGVSDFRWCPDGSAMIVASAVLTDPDARGARQSKPAKEKASSPEVAWKLPYKSDDVGFLLSREIHLFRLDVATGQQTRLTDGAFDVLAFDVSPDGSQIAYCRTREGRFAHRLELWVCKADGTEHRLLIQELATVGTPAWSPDGQFIAFTGAAKEADSQTTLWLSNLASGVFELFAGENLEIAAGTSPHWSADGSELIFSEAHHGRHRLVSGNLGTRSLKTLVEGDRQFGAFGCHGQQLVYSVESPVLPSELWRCTGDEQETQISDLNPWWRERIDITAEVKSFEVPDGQGGTECIEGWLIRAADQTTPGPLLNDVHGGPASYALMDFDTNVFWQVLCSKGWSVLALNAVGSSSFGREFCDRLAGHWGEYDLPQHMAALAALKEERISDGRVAISGKSYGGFLSAWAIGHTDDFGAAVVMAPVGNIETHYGTSDGGYYADPFYLGTQPVFNRKLARELSPLQYVERASTPTLFMQGKDDERCPKCQSEELFVSMMRAGTTPAELVLYPGENHSFLGQGKPSCREDAARRIVQWITEHACKRSPANAEVEAQEESMA